MSSYKTVRDEIGTQLAAVTGIGKVFKHWRHVTEWKTFLERFKHTDGKINVCMITRKADTEAGSGIGSTTEEDKIEAVEESEVWQIELFYGHKDDDDDDASSESIFNELVDNIETKFRFLQDLNAKAYKSFPLQRLDLSWGSLGEVFCHRALWQLRLQHRILNPNPDA